MSAVDGAVGHDGGRAAAADRFRALRRSGLLRRATFDHLDRLTRLASSLTDAPVALISMVDEDRQFFTSQHGLGDPWASDRETPLSHSVCQTVVSQQTPLVLDALGDHASFADHPARHDIDVQAYCGVPIRDPDGVVLGSFCVIDDDRHEWSPETVAMLQLLAEVVTDWIGNTRDYAEMVQDLQLRLLPGGLPEVSGGHLDARYRSVVDVEAIGGDFYDAIHRPDGSLDLVLGDAIGHGVRSTHAAAQLRAAARAVLAGATDTPATIINRIAAACVDLPGCDGAALLVARISPDGTGVRWARAGAMPPVLTGPDATVLEGGASPPLGVGECTFDPACERVLEPGEGIVLFSDGLVERRDEAIDAGLARLAKEVANVGGTEAVPWDEVIDQVCPEDDQFDDLALIHYQRDGA